MNETHRLSLLFVLFLAAFVAGAGLSNAEDWPQFRGPNASGVSWSDAPLPVEFSATENVAWSIEMGDGIGSPVIAAGRVFTI